MRRTVLWIGMLFAGLTGLVIMAVVAARVVLLSRQPVSASPLVSIAAAGVAGGHWAVAAPAAGAHMPASPTATVVLTPDADSYVVSFSETNYGSAHNLLVNFDLAGETWSRALLHFSMTDLAGQLPHGATVQSATLQLYLRSGSAGSVTLTAYRGEELDWTEDGVNWFNQPAWVQPGNAQSINNTPGHKNWDVTAVVLGWLSGTFPNRGIGILGSESGANYTRDFDSRTGENPPQLVVVYTAPTGTPTATPTPSPAAGTTRSGRLTATRTAGTQPADAAITAQTVDCSQPLDTISIHHNPRVNCHIPYICVRPYPAGRWLCSSLWRLNDYAGIRRSRTGTGPTPDVP